MRRCRILNVDLMLKGEFSRALYRYLVTTLCTPLTSKYTEIFYASNKILKFYVFEKNNTVPTCQVNGCDLFT